MSYEIVRDVQCFISIISIHFYSIPEHPQLPVCCSRCSTCSVCSAGSGPVSLFWPSTESSRRWRGWRSTMTLSARKLLSFLPQISLQEDLVTKSLTSLLFFDIWLPKGPRDYNTIYRIVRRWLSVDVLLQVVIFSSIFHIRTAGFQSANVTRFRCLNLASLELRKLWWLELSVGSLLLGLLVVTGLGCHS